MTNSWGNRGEIRGEFTSRNTRRESLGRSFGTQQSSSKSTMGLSKNRLPRNGLSITFPIGMTTFMILGDPHCHIFSHTQVYMIPVPGPVAPPLPPRDGLLGTMRQKAFHRNDLERDKKHSSLGYSSFCMITCCYALALHLYLSTHLLLC